MDDIITAKVVFERGSGGLNSVAGVKGGTSSGGSSAGGLMGAAGIKMSASMASAAAAIAIGVVVLKGIQKAVEGLAKISPRLQASLNIFRKSFEIMLRPIGDILSMFLRPFAIMMLRWGIKFYKKFAGNRSKIQDSIEDFGPVKLAKGGEDMSAGDWMETSAFIGGSIPGMILGALMDVDWIGAFNNIVNLNIDAWNVMTSWFSDTFIPGIETAWETFSAIMATGFESFGNWIENDLVPGITDAWAGFSSWITEDMVPGIESAWNSFGDWIIDDLIPGVESAWGGIVTWFDDNIIIPIQTSWASIVTWFDDNIISPIMGSWESIVTWFDDNIISPIKNAWSGFVDWIKDIFSFDWLNLPDWIPGFATGGYATQEGLYHLHQGETVVPAGGSNTYNTSPTINVNANISNDMDINSLAERLSELTMQKMNSQMSYRF